VIASDLPSIREFAGEHPFYIEAGDCPALALGIERLLDGDPDAEARRINGRDAVGSLRWSALGDLTAAVIEEVADMRRPTVRHTH
jgi:hypothetical protein